MNARIVNALPCRISSARPLAATACCVALLHGFAARVRADEPGPPPAAGACTVISGPNLARQSGRLTAVDATHIGLASADGRQGVDLPLNDVVWIDFNAPPGIGDAALPNGTAPRVAQSSTPGNNGPRSGRRRLPVETQSGGRTSAAAAAASESPASPAGDFLLVLRNGERLRGTPTSIGGDTLVWQTRSLGQRSINVAQIAGLARVTTPAELDSLAATLAGPSTQPAGAADATQDELRLGNGDVVRGVVASADARAITVQTVDGQSVPVEWDNIRRVRLAQLPGTESGGGKPAPASFLVRTVAGDAIRCATLTIGGDGKLAITAADGSGSIALTELRSIDHLDGGVRSLANLPPATSTYEPFFPPADGSAAGAPAAVPASITVAGQTTRAFLLARPHSRLTWQLDALGGDLRPQHFRTRFGIPDGRPYANATVRVLVDDKVVTEQANVTAGTLSDPLDVPIASGAHTLTLEVDYGNAFGVQDDVVWFEPVLILAK